MVSCFYFRPFTSLIIWTEKVTDNSASLFFFYIRITCLYRQYIINPNIVQWRRRCAPDDVACAPKCCCSLRSRWNNLLCKLWNLTLCIKWMWNKSSPPQRFHTPQAYFTFTEQIFHIEDISLVSTEQISLKKAFAILCKNTAYSFYNV